MSCYDFALGFKLNLWWRRQLRLGELPPPDGDLYRLLADRGFAYFEASVGTCRADDELALLDDECAACADAGLGMSIHPYLEPPFNPAFMGVEPEAEETIGHLLSAAELAASATGVPATLVLHPATLVLPEGVPDAATRGVLLRRSREYIVALTEGALTAVRPVIEHQLATRRGERIIRIGDTYDELLRLVDGVEVGLCWDTGHYLLAVDRHGQPEFPPAEFVRRVEHVHLHAVVGEVDHCVIGPGSRGLPTYLRMLADEGFSGTLTLEYSAAAILAGGSFDAAIDRSLAALAAYLA